MREGAHVKAFASTEAFVDAYRPRPRQCLILDQHLHGMRTGLEFLASPDWVVMCLPVILVTGQGNDAINAQAKEAGVAAFLDKPIDFVRLMAAIDRVVGISLSEPHT